MHAFKLKWGLPVAGGVVRDIALRPLTIGGELAAMALLDERWGDTPPTGSQAAVVETLAYWTQQLVLPGHPDFKPDIDYLLANLTGDDYRLILAAQDDLRAKYTAATANPAGSVAATASPDTKAATATTAKP